MKNCTIEARPDSSCGDVQKCDAIRAIPDRGRWSKTLLDGYVNSAARVLGVVAMLFLSGTTWAQSDYLPSPVRIALGGPGELLVADSRSQIIVTIYPGKGRKSQSIDVPGRPVSVAAGWNKYFVGNERTQTVDVLDRKGQLLYTLGGEGLYIERPSDIAVDIDAGLVFVTDTATARVLVFQHEGALVRTIPAAGQKALVAPTGVYVDTVRGEVLVSDFEAAGNSFMAAGGILIYSYDGTYLTAIRGDQAGGYDFSRPQGLTVNAQGHIYLVDSFRGQVLVFDRETRKGIATFGAPGKKSGELLLPLDIVIDARSNDVYVTNNRNQRIEVFPGEGVRP